MKTFVSTDELYSLAKKQMSIKLQGPDRTLDTEQQEHNKLSENVDSQSTDIRQTEVEPVPESTMIHLREQMDIARKTIENAWADHRNVLLAKHCWCPYDNSREGMAEAIMELLTTTSVATNEIGKISSCQARANPKMGQS